MKIKIQLNDGYEEIIEVDEEEGEIKDLGTTKEMLQAQIEKLTQLNRDMSGDVAFYHEANMECKKTIEELRKKADGWEKRCNELEQENRELQHDHCEMLDRIHEQDVTIAKYDDENRELKAKYIAWDRGSTALTRWAKAIHENAVAHGWWEDGDRPFPEIVALCHSELSEALEEYRCDKPMEYQIKEIGISPYGKPAVDITADLSEFKNTKKPEGIAVEMIDCIIRILDWCGKEGIDVDAVLRRKHEYNKSRPYRHGGKKA